MAIAREYVLNLDSAELAGTLVPSSRGNGLVIFAHGSGSSRHSPRNIFVARKLQSAGFGTLLFDLLTPEEDQDPAIRFDIDLLASRLIRAIEWSTHQHETRQLPIGLFGASTGAAAGIYAAAHFPKLVGAVVSRGGRPDMAMDAACLVHCPTLLIVGGNDRIVLDLNNEAYEALPGSTVKELQIVEGAGHLFEEPGALEQVAELAASWFSKHLPQP